MCGAALLTFRVSGAAPQTPGVGCESVSVAPFVAQVPLRWTDQDSYRHLNHARTSSTVMAMRSVCAR